MRMSIEVARSPTLPSSAKSSSTPSSENRAISKSKAAGSVDGSARIKRARGSGSREALKMEAVATKLVESSVIESSISSQQRKTPFVVYLSTAEGTHAPRPATDSRASDVFEAKHRQMLLKKCRQNGIQAPDFRVSLQLASGRSLVWI